MLKILPVTFLVLLLIPFSQGFAQVTDTPPTLTLSLKNETPFVYKDSEGYTVVVGAVKNTNSLTSVTNVNLQVSFYDDFDPNPLEVVAGQTVLEVIPANGESPFAIRSETANPNITQASVSLGNFDSSEDKTKGLTVFSTDVYLDTSLQVSGILRNSGAPNSDANVYLAYYDAFDPPRILGVSTIEIGNLEPNAEVPFDLDTIVDYRAAGFLLFAESDVFYSDFVDVKIPPPQTPKKFVTISNISVEDNMGNKLSEIKKGSTVNIKSATTIEFAEEESNETAYTYYVQIRESGTSPYVEFIGKFDGRFIKSGLETQTIDWIPQNSGLYFIQTFVWDRNNVPLADPGPIVLILVN